MDDPGQEQPPITHSVQYQYMTNPYQANQMINTTSISGNPLTPTSQAQLAQEQLTYQQVHQQKQHQLQEQLQMFQESQYHEIMAIKEFKNHSLPLARIKKIMKADEDVKMIAAEAPLLFSRACEMFIMELTYRSWVLAKENNRRTLLKNDLAGAIMRTDIFDFLADVVPKEELKEVVHSTGSCVGGFDDPLSYYYGPPHVGSLGTVTGENEVDQSFSDAQQPQPYMPQQHIWDQQQKIQQQYPDDGS